MRRPAVAPRSVQVHTDTRAEIRRETRTTNRQHTDVHPALTAAPLTTRLPGAPGSARATRATRRGRASVGRRSARAACAPVTRRRWASSGTALSTAARSKNHGLLCVVQFEVKIAGVVRIHTDGRSAVAAPAAAATATAAAATTAAATARISHLSVRGTATPAAATHSVRAVAPGSAELIQRTVARPQRRSSLVAIGRRCGR